jgi:alpha,alpha-trehalase
MYHLELALSKACVDDGCSQYWEAKAKSRADAINRFLWCNGSFYCDFDLIDNVAVFDNPNAAMMFPLYVGLADTQRANLTAATMKSVLLAKGGVVTTTINTTQQWDYPMGWAPLQWVVVLFSSCFTIFVKQFCSFRWVAVQGLKRYGMNAMAQVVTQRFLTTVRNVYNAQSKLVEKYDVVNQDAGGGGELFLFLAYCFNWHSISQENIHW